MATSYSAYAIVLQITTDHATSPPMAVAGAGQGNGEDSSGVGTISVGGDGSGEDDAGAPARLRDDTARTARGYAVTIAVLDHDVTIGNSVATRDGSDL